MIKLEMLELVKEKVCQCTKCPELVANRKQIVFDNINYEEDNLLGNVGNEHAEIMICGECPGIEEDKAGIPFVGAAGQVLNQIIKACGWRREDLYICNILKCMSPYNRTPTPEQVNACLPYLHLQIKIVNPKYIVCLGKTAANYLLQKDATISSLRGLHYHEGRMVLCTYHPSYLLRQNEQSEYIKVAQDFKQLLDYIGK